MTFLPGELSHLALRILITFAFTADLGLNMEIFRADFIYRADSPISILLELLSGVNIQLAFSIFVTQV
jgi:hypothetical protein